MSSDNNNLNDEELIKLLYNGNRRAFDALYYRYFAKLYSVAYKRVKSKEDAEEIIQELFTNLWIKRELININQNFSSYIFTAVKYMIFKYYRKEGVQKVYAENLSIVYSELENTTEEIIFFNDLNLQFENAVNNLPDKSKTVFSLSRKEHKTNKEIAYQLGITEKAVEYHITKALSLLRINLKDFAALLFILAFQMIK